MRRENDDLHGRRVVECRRSVRIQVCRRRVVLDRENGKSLSDVSQIGSAEDPVRYDG